MAVNKVVYGSDTLIDLTTDTVAENTLAQGITAHDKSGAQIVGTMEPGKQVVSGTFNPRYSYSGYYTVNVGFQPRYVSIYNYTNNYYKTCIYDNGTTYFCGAGSSYDFTKWGTDDELLIVTETGFQVRLDVMEAWSGSYLYPFEGTNYYIVAE